ncbi:MAG: site-specific integrase [Treponema sp.]|nr:site-specific integrase [Treponema sp.]
MQYSENEGFMRVKDDFTLYRRKLASGVVVFYYQCYDAGGRRLCGHSTGKTTKTEARKECIRLLQQGLLVPAKQKMPTFAEYAEGWWDFETCDYLKNQKGRKDITESYANNCKAMVKNQILPFFGNTLLDKITTEAVNGWLLGFKERKVTSADGKEETRSYKNTYANTVFGTLWLMLNEAVNRNILKSNPAAPVKKLKNDRKHIEIITPAEVKQLFPVHWEAVWEGDHLCYAANKLAACTGMRIGEILGLRGEYVFDDYIHVKAQYDEYGYRPTKTKETRNIPLAPVIMGELRRLMERNGRGFLFSLDEGATPVSRTLIYKKFHKALVKIGVSKAEIRRRGLSMHSWRHFFNTTLQMANVALSKVQSVTGHKSDRMTEWYTHYDAKEFSEVRNVQETLLLPDRKTKNGVKETKRGGGTAKEGGAVRAEKPSAVKGGGRGKPKTVPKQKAGRAKKQA